MRRALAALVGLALALVLAEGLLRGPLRPELVHARGPAWQAATRAMHAALHQPDAELIYTPRPGAAMPMDYGLAAFNALGLREPEGRPAEAPTGARVLVLGDSLVFGELLAPEHTLPARLDAALGPGVEVLNLGVTGYDTTQELGWYRRVGRALRPDLVVLVFCLNDLLTASGPLHLYGQPEHLAAWRAEREALDALAPLRNETISALWWRARSGSGSQARAALAHAWRWHRLFTLPGGYVDEPLLSTRDPARVRRFEQAVAALGEDLAADGVQGVLLISPALYWWHDYKWGALHGLARDAGEDAGFVVLDPITAWAGGDPEPLRFPGDNLHYTAEGTRRLAAFAAPALAEALRGRGRPPEP